MCSRDKRGGGKHVRQYLFIQRREARGNFHGKSRPALILVRQPPFPAFSQTPQKEQRAHAAEKKKMESGALCVGLQITQNIQSSPSKTFQKWLPSNTATGQPTSGLLLTGRRKVPKLRRIGYD